MNMKSVAAVILTMNEEMNVLRCAESLIKSFPVIVVDSGSRDATVSIAKSVGCEVIETHWRGFAAQRNFVLEELNGRYDFVLFVDADEIFGEDIQSWVIGNIESNKIADVVYFSQRIVLGDAVLRYAPAYPIYHPRLVRTDFKGFVDNHSSHGETVPKDVNHAFVDIPYMHYILSNGLPFWLTKHVRLGMAELGSRVSDNGVATARSKLNAKVPIGFLRVLARFFYHYILCRGFLDGRAGLNYSLMYSWYELTKLLLGRERRGGV